MTATSTLGMCAMRWPCRRQSSTCSKPTARTAPSSSFSNVRERVGEYVPRGPCGAVTPGVARSRTRHGASSRMGCSGLGGTLVYPRLGSGVHVQPDHSSSRLIYWFTKYDRIKRSFCLVGSVLMSAARRAVLPSSQAWPRSPVRPHSRHGVVRPPSKEQCHDASSFRERGSGRCRRARAGGLWLRFVRHRERGPSGRAGAHRFRGRAGGREQELHEEGLCPPDALVRVQCHL